MDVETNIEDILEALCSKQKLERDKTLNNLMQNISNYDASTLISLFSSLISVIQKTEIPWESYHGNLLAVSKLLSTECGLLIDENHLNEVREAATRLLTHAEVRVRLASGEVLGSLCTRDNCITFSILRTKILLLIRENLDRERSFPSGNSNVTPEQSNGVESISNKPRERRGSGNAEQIFHDTAGWRNLETSMKCLDKMIGGCGNQFVKFIDQELLELLFVSLTHTNRFVRETGYSVCTAMVSCGVSEEDPTAVENPMLIFGDQLAKHLACGLADNWSQVRLSASIAARMFLITLPVGSREKFFPVILPRICLNRYYVAEGVRLYSQESWRLVTGGEGRNIVEKYISNVVPYYIEATTADNHAVREAACECIAELALKISESAVSPYVQELLLALTVCFNDDSWPVRDAACLACGNFISCFPEQSYNQIEELFPLFFNNLQDNIPSVRQGAASALLNVVKAYQELALPRVTQWIKEALQGVENQSTETHKYSNLESGPATYGVAKQIRDNDIDLHSNQQMYSCGSLAPKMGRGGGGCSGGHFRRPAEHWEKADGSLFLMGELSSLPQLGEEVSKLLPVVATACSFRHYSSHLSVLESLCKTLPVMAKGLGKRLFKPRLYLFFDAIFYAVSSENALASLAASECLKELAEFLGPSILRGRVQEYNPTYLDSLERICEVPP